MKNGTTIPVTVGAGGSGVIQVTSSDVNNGNNDGFPSSFSAMLVVYGAKS